MPLKIVFWDVQHGNATYVSTPSGHHIAIDLGTGSLGKDGADFSPLLHLKQKWDVTRLDGVIITHPHRDHLDDIGNFDELNPRVLTRPKHLSENAIREGNQAKDQSILDKYLEIDRRYNQPVKPETSPYRPANNGGVDIQTFTPTTCAPSNLNNHSVVTVIRYANITTVIPGDNEAASWKELLDRERFLNAMGLCFR